MILEGRGGRGGVPNNDGEDRIHFVNKDDEYTTLTDANSFFLNLLGCLLNLELTCFLRCSPLFILQFNFFPLFNNIDNC